MKKVNVLFLFVCVFCFISCQFEEEPPLSHLYAGKYVGTMQVSESDAGKISLTEGCSVDMSVAGDDRLNLKFYNVVVRDIHIEEMSMNARLENDGMNRISGELRQFPVSTDLKIDADMLGTIIYKDAELIISLNINNESTGKSGWTIQFFGIRK